MLLRVSKTPKTLPLKSAENTSPSRIDRREFIKTGCLAAGGLAFGVPALLRGQNLNSKLNIACIGIGGKGRSDTDACADENIVALCDVDSGSAAYAVQTKKYPSAKIYKDFRELLEQMGNQIDAVTVSTPDHMHAIVASAAMKRNKAVSCQKPLTQTIYEARQLTRVAAEKPRGARSSRSSYSSYSSSSRPRYTMVFFMNEGDIPSPVEEQRSACSNSWDGEGALATGAKPP